MSAYYHSDEGCESPGLSSSLVKIISEQSPAHAWAHHPKNPARLPDDEANRLDIGTAAHALLLEQADDRLVIVDADDWRTKSAREARDDARLNGKVPVLAKQADTLREMVKIAHESIAKCSDFGYCLSDGVAETPIYWQEGAVECRALPDWVSHDNTVIVDYKTTAASNPRAFERGIYSMSYDIQAAWYCRAIQAASGVAPKFVWLVQEIEPPFAVYFIGATPSMLAIAWQKCEQAISQWSECLKTGIFTGYGNRIMWSEPPAWAFADAEKRAIDAGNESWDAGNFLIGRVEK